MIPIRTSISPRKTPYANYILILLNIVIFILSVRSAIDPQTRERVIALRAWAEQFMLTPIRPYLWQFVTYAFLHGSLMHILGNMYFLYLFGNNVNDKLGHIGYTCFYLTGGVFAGIGHTLLHVNPVLGASGAVAAVTGAYLVLFPKTVITVLYWFFLIGTFDLSALYFIIFKMIVWDNIIEAKFAADAIAYDAHLAGYVFGVAAVTLLFAVRLIDTDYSDMWSMIKQWNRRRRFRDTVDDGYDPYKGLISRKAVKANEVKKTPDQQAREDKITQMRTEIMTSINKHNLPHAAEIYLKLTDIEPENVMPRQYQLDLANQLMSMGKWGQSATAYEKFLSHYPSYEYAEQVHLMLGLIYCRYLKQADRAMKYLTIARDKLTDPSQIKMCDDELKRLQN
jgi:membrane associated rhomboid family serine protease